jgi:3-deoxy-D-arabino-heptulosonate 7-phosphate (DAHP) synthase class II
VPNLISLLKVSAYKSSFTKSDQPDIGHAKIAKFLPKILDGVQANHSSHEQSDPFHTERYQRKRNWETKKVPDLVTQPIEIPVNASHIHQSKENDLLQI